MSGSKAKPPRGLAGVVCRKELRETFRDKRTLLAVVVSPLLITPLLLGLVGTVVTKQLKQERVETVPVGIVGLAGSPSMQDALKGAPNLKMEPVTEAEAETAIRERRLRAAVLLPPDAEALMREQREVPVRLLVDEGSDSSQKAAARLKALFEGRGKRVVALRLMEQGLSSEMVSPFSVRETAIEGGGTRATLMLAAILPYILVIAAVLGSVYAANDMVAGEKERGTLEALLVSPASRRDLVLGKFLSVATVSMVSSVLSVVGLMLPFFLPLPGLDWMRGEDLKLTGVGVAVMFLVQVPLAVLGAGLLLAVSTYARNQKEAQSYLTPVMLLVTVAAMLSMLLKTEAHRALALVPILNAAMALKQALSNSVDPVFVGVAFAASILYAVLAMLFATRLFERESVLLKA